MGLERFIMLPEVDAASSLELYESNRENGGARIDSTSAMSCSPAPNPKSANLDCLFGNRTLSSLALPSFEFGSSCSRSIENRADRPVMRRLVRKSSVGGSADAKSSSFLASSCDLFLPNMRNGPDASDSIDSRAAATSSLFFFLVRNRFIVKSWRMCVS